MPRRHSLLPLVTALLLAASTAACQDTPPPAAAKTFTTATLATFDGP